MKFLIIQALGALRNQLGKTILVDDIFLKSSIHYVAQFLVEVVVSMGLYDSIEVVWKD